jgi:signal transduction histidine kinase/AmiR/NasT family two-component response regulator
MPQCTLTAEPIALSTFMELTRELSVGQRVADTPVRLHTFLHRRIFPKLGRYHIELYLRNSDNSELRPPTSIQTLYSGNVPAVLPLHEPLLIGTFCSDQPVTFQTTDELPACFRTTGNATHLLIPLLDRNTIVGSLYIGSAKPQSFSHDFLLGMMTFTSVIGSRLSSMKTIRQLKYSMRALEYSEQIRSALYEISEQAHSSASLDDLYGSMHKTVNRLIHARNFIIALVEQRSQGTFYQFPYFADQHDSYFQGQKVKLNPEKKSLTAYLLESRQPLLLTPDNFETICSKNHIHFMGTRPHSWLGVPFYLDHISGAVIIQSYDDVIYTEKDKRLMSFVARHVGDALAKRQALDELRAAKDRAEQAEKNKSAFLANMSHEIRTPMNGIIGMTDLALELKLPKKIRTYLGMVRTSSDRLLKIINDILDFSKIEAGKLDLIEAPFQLKPDISDALQLLTLNARQKGITLKVEYAEQLPAMVVGDSGRLCQIITNLVANGIKFTEQGSVTLSVRETIAQPEKPDQITLHFQVRDTGVGIPENKINHVFRAFSQIGTTLDHNNRGTGLGLVIAAELVEKMGGRIWIESVPGTGTTFHFTTMFALPPYTALAPSIRQSNKHQYPKIKTTLNILLAEDEYINQTLAKTVLEQVGWNVTIAENGLAVLNFLTRGRKQQHFDLILMDIQMPDMDGFETTRLIRDREKNTGNHIPIIAMTAYAVNGDKEKCLKAGMDGYISKPIKSGQLQAVIETILHTEKERLADTGSD